MTDFWWTASDQEFANFYNSLKYSVVADLVATLPYSDELHSPLKDVEKSYTHYQTPNYPAAVGRLLQALRKIYLYYQGAGMEYIDRGDPTAVDFQVANLTTDGNWHELDLSAIIPTTAKVVFLKVQVTDGSSGMYFEIRKKGNSNNINTFQIRTQVNYTTIDAGMHVPVGTDGIIEYRTTNNQFLSIYITVKGWTT